MRKLLLSIGILIILCQAIAAQECAQTDIKYCELKYNLSPLSTKIESENKIHFSISGGNSLPVLFELKYNFHISDIITLSNKNTLKFNRFGDSLLIFPNKKWQSTDSICIKFSGELTKSADDALDFNLLFTVHELSHQWFGNAITCNSWNEVWLNESLATYSEYLAIEKGLIPDISPEEWLTQTLANAKVQGSIILKNPKDYVDVFFFNKQCINDKGAIMIHSLRGIIGDDAFFKGLKNYATDPNLKYHTAKSEDFIRHFEKVSNKDLKPFFNKWLYGEDIPTDLK